MITTATQTETGTKVDAKTDPGTTTGSNPCAETTGVGTGSGSPCDPAGGGAAARGLVSLHPEDGLFLRAEHLTTIQDYARALTLAVGQAAGAGVVWGLDLSIDVKEGELVAAPGLAVNGLGRPLLSRVSVRADLPQQSGTQASSTAYWVVQACLDGQLSGSENRYGNLCDDGCGCGGGATIQPFCNEGVKLQLSPRSEARLGDQDPERRRSWLASWYFEQERRLGEPWLTRGTEAEVVGSRLQRDWFRGPAEPTTACVPLGVLLRVGDQWVLDTWTARRDIGGGHAEDGWRWRLGMRPWGVFMAHVLQFQDQLAPYVPDLVNPAVTARAVVDPGRPLIEQFFAQRRDVEEVRRLAEQWAKLDGPFALYDSTTSLYDKGFVELPPAGFLPSAPSQDELERKLDALFDQRVSWRLCSASADAIARAVDQAQHLDRIPLTRAKNLPQVDVLVPDQAPDLPVLATSYDWVAFVRNRRIACVRALDTVEVYTMEVSVGRHQLAPGLGLGPGSGERMQGWLRVLLKGATFERIGALRYPKDTWEFPGGELASSLGDIDTRVVGILAVPDDESRAPLTALRGQLFAGSFARQPLHVVVVAEQDEQLPAPEALVLLVIAEEKEVGTEEGTEDGTEDGTGEVVFEEGPVPPPAAPPPPPMPMASTASKSAASKAAASKTTAKAAASKTTAKTAASETTAKAAAKSTAAKRAATPRTRSTRATGGGR